MSVPNQKHVIIKKEKCDGEKREHYYAAINLIAMDKAAQNLDAGAFKLWCYFAKNQNGYDFDLSSKAVEENFGIKIKQYNNAVNELIAKGYLVNTKGNNYIFNEISVITKEDNAVITKSNNTVITKKDNELLPKEIRNITQTTFNNTKDITEAREPQAPSQQTPQEEEEVKYQKVSKREMLSLGVPYETIDESKSLYRIKATNKIVQAV